MKLKVITGIVAVIVLLGCVAGGWWYLEDYQAVFYTQVDNTHAQELTSGDMAYEYTLVCYDASGKSKTLKFKTARLLREGAYLSLDVLASGVHTWEEVSHDALPQKVQEKLPAAE